MKNLKIKIVKENNRIDEVYNLIYKSFNYFTKPNYSNEINEWLSSLFSKEILKNFINESKQCFRFVAINENNKIIGTIDLINGKSMRKLYIDPDYQKQGIGKALMDQSINYIFTNTSCQKIIVKSAVSRVSYHNKTFGFKPIGDITVLYNNYSYQTLELNKNK